MRLPSAPERRLAGGVAGLLAAGCGVAAGVLTAALQGGPSPLLAVGGVAIDLAPAPLKDFAVSHLGTADKPLLLTGLGAVIVVLAVVAGVLGVRRAWLGFALLTLLGFVGLAAAASGRSLSEPLVTRVLPSVVALVVTLIAFGLLLGTIRVPGRHRQSTARTSAGTDAVVATDTSITSVEGDRLPAGFDRRRFMATALAVGGIGIVAGAAGELIPSRGTAAAVRLPAPTIRAGPVPAGAAPSVPGLSPFFTPNAEFYRVDIALDIPQLNASTWRLRVHGLVDHPLDLSFADLVGRRLVERDITLTCVSNEVGGPYVGNARWIGVPIAELLDEVGVRPGADAVKSTAYDGFTIGTPLDVLADPNRHALLAVGMNGRPLPPVHGFPVRMVVPGLYGYVSATKWLVDLEVMRFDRFQAYWTSRGWSVRAPIKTSSRIDVPGAFARVRSGPVTVAGVAWAQHTGIDRVEVRVDRGPWHPVRLATADTPDTWRPWTWTWPATPGNHTLEVRATDRSGHTQTSRRVPPRPDGSSGWHSVVVTVT